MQKKDPKYYDLKEDTAWTMEQFKFVQFIFFDFMTSVCLVIMSIKILQNQRISKKIGL